MTETSFPLSRQDYVNRKLRETEPSASLEAAQLARDLRTKGRPVISLATGEPDFPTPNHIKNALVEALAADYTGYPTVQGIPALREAIQEKFRKDNGLDYALNEILVGNGVKQIIFNAMAASLEPGDEVLMPAPGWVSYSEMVRLNGGAPVSLPCSFDKGFHLAPSTLEAAITDKTRWLILNNPSNPTGAVMREDEIRAIAAILERHPKILVLSDDIYEHIRYDGVPYFTIAQVSDEMKTRTLTCNGVSKAWCMTGWRIGFAGGPKPLIDAMRVYQSQTTGGVMHPAQYGAVAALRGERDFMAANLEEFRRRRDLAAERINAVPGLSCHAPEGAFYLFVECGALIGMRTPSGETVTDDAALTRYLVEEAEVVCVPGTAFGMSPFFRVSFASDTAVLDEACTRLAAAVAKLEPVKETTSA